MGLGSLFVGLGLLCLSLTVISRPWRRQTGSDGAPNHAAGRVAEAITPARDDLAARRDGIYGALADLDFDRSIDKLNNDDYQVVRSQLMAQAVEVLQQLDTSSAAAARIESRVETLVRARRGTSSGRAATGRPDARSSALLGLMNIYCSDCGSALKPDDRFCGKCGSPVAACCPQCGAAVGVANGFCIRCGAALLAEAVG